MDFVALVLCMSNPLTMITVLVWKLFTLEGPPEHREELELTFREEEDSAKEWLFGLNSLCFSSWTKKAKTCPINGN